MSGGGGRRATPRGPAGLPALRAALVGAGALLQAGATAAEQPQVHYMLHCQGCHLADGSGASGAVPSLRDQIGRFVTVPGGREYLVRVPGSAQSSLSDAELAAVLTWMIRAFGPAEIAATLEPFSSEEVARHRNPPLAEVDSVRRELLGRIEAGPGAPPGAPESP